MVDVAPTQTVKSAASPGDLALVAHRGDRGVLLAMDLPQERTDRLAGFALYRKTPGGVERPLLNRLDFATPVTSATTPAERRWHPSDKAPFQKFRWVDMPSPVEAGTYRYTATARYFGGTGGLVDGPSAFVDIDLADEHLGALTIGFTRGYISSQAYADRFHNAPFEPDPPTVDFDTTPYRAQYQWLGFHARELVMSFLADCQSDLSVTLDVFAFDLNEPDVIRMMAGFGSRLRLYLDNSPTHVDHADKPKARPAMEPQAQKAIEATGGAVKTGHFGSLAHDKVLIARRNGTPFRVLTGSANFSVRGLYVQSNNVLVFESAEVAGLYGLAFDQAWQNAPGFRNSAVAAQWSALPAGIVPDGRVAFSPHSDPAVSLSPIVDSLNGAKSSVLFAVMDLSGGGPVLQTLRGIADRSGIFSYGITQTTKDFALYKPGSRRGIRIPFAFLSAHVPAPFNKEWDGGFGQVIHHKFAVVDFNGDSPVVYTGSSNLAQGGERNNGDNLLELRGPAIASLYAVEAIKMIDHYHFRAAMKTATTDSPLILAGPADWQKWVAPYYDPNDLKSLDRQIFAR
jgi:phosphatidylserine/phosphatidylglycerophosphate/cardiolipin synthase-like enzyme